MVQIVKGTKKKGRPSKADLALRAAAAPPCGSPDRRRSLRRKTLRYNVDLDEDDEEDEDDYSAEEDEEDLRRREKKLKLVVLKLSPHGGEESGGNRRMGANGLHAPSSGYDVSASSSEYKPVKRRRIGGDGDFDYDDEVGIDDDGENEYEDKGRKRNSRGVDSLPGTPSDPPSSFPLPDKKSLEAILDKLQKKDIYGVYAEPVDPEELPDYHDIVEHPMDFSTVRKKLGNGSYYTLEQLEGDIFLICSNAMQYNTPDTVYYKQASSMQELARRKFERLRIEFERSEKELKSEQKKKHNSLPKRQFKKPISRITQEPVGSDYSSATILATAGDVQNGLNKVNTGCERPSNIGVVEGTSSQVDINFEKTEELFSGKTIPCRFGRKASMFDENRRTTYNATDQPRSEPVFSVFEGENRHLVRVGLHAEHSYAKSLARFAASLGPVAWRVAHDRIQQVLPPGLKFGRGWVGEYEPLPTSVLVLQTRTPFSKEDQIFKEPISTKQHCFPSSADPKNRGLKQVSVDQCSADPGSLEKAIVRNPSLPAPNGMIPRSTSNGKAASNSLDKNPSKHSSPVWICKPNAEDRVLHRKHQVSADSTSPYNSTREFLSQTVQPQEGLFQGFGGQGIRGGNREGLGSPKFITPDLYRFQVQSPPPRPRLQQDAFPTDLNIGFQLQSSESSGVLLGSQHPDLALQL